MKPFAITTPKTLKEAIGLLKDERTTVMPKAGGIDFLDEWKGMTVAPDLVVNLVNTSGTKSLVYDGRQLRIGPLTTLAELAASQTVQQKYTALAHAAGEAATPQIRNVATVGGNLCQRPRCWYYRNWAIPCLKKGGDVCYAIEGENQYHAIFGNGPCHIVHPSNIAPALVAFNAAIQITGPKGERSMPAEHFFTMPADNPNRENVLEPNELVSGIVVPPFSGRSAYMEVREKQSFDWPLVSATVAMSLNGRTCTSARIVLGGVAPIPWRVPSSEKLLTGKSVDESLAARAAEAAVTEAKPMSQNGYKVQLAKVVLRRTILEAANAAA